MSANTAGPWKACILNLPLNEIPAYVDECISASPLNDFFFISGMHDDGLPVDVYHVGNGPRGNANARLISAAPDMYEALTEARDYVLDCLNAESNQRHSRAERPDYYAGLLAQIDAALAKTVAK